MVINLLEFLHIIVFSSELSHDCSKQRTYFSIKLENRRAKISSERIDCSNGALRKKRITARAAVVLTIPSYVVVADRRPSYS